MPEFNTGIKRYTQLREVYVYPNGDRVPTGNIKDNVEGDPDYVPDELDPTTCPTTSTTTTSSTTTSTTTTTTTVPDSIIVTAEITNNTLNNTWRVIAYLSAAVGVDVQVEGTFYVNGEGLPYLFVVVIPAGQLFGMAEIGAAEVGDIPSDVEIISITPSSYNGTPITT